MKIPHNSIFKKYAQVLGVSASVLLVQHPTFAATYYWDENGATAGFGNAGAVGTTWSSTTSLFSTDSAGTTAPTGTTASTAVDGVNFGTAAAGLGAGTITVSGTVTSGSISIGSASGALVFTGGTITLGGNISSSQNSATRITTINSSLDLNGATRTFSTTGTATALNIAGVISGAAGIVANSNGGATTLSGLNTFTGDVSIGNLLTGGNLKVSLIGNQGSITSNLGAGTTVSLGGLGGTGALVYTGAGETSNRLFTMGSSNAASAGVINNSGSGTLTLSGTFTSSGANHTLTLRGVGTTSEYSGIMSDGATSLSIAKTDSGTWNLSGVNTFDGNITVTQGTLGVTGAGQLGAGTYAGTISNAGTFTYGSSATQTLSGIISGAGALNVSNGNLTLSATNTYTGATTISGGTLLINGSNSGSATTVNGGRLGGTGTTGTVTVNTGGTLAAGNGIGTLTTSDLTMNGSSVFAADINTSALTSDKVVSGLLTLDLANSVVLNLSDLGSNVAVSGFTFTLIDYSGSWNGGLFTYNGSILADDSQFAFGANTYQISYNGVSGFDTEVTLTTAAVPEPSTVALFGLGLAGLFWRNRRRSAQA